MTVNLALLLSIVVEPCGQCDTIAECAALQGPKKQMDDWGNVYVPYGQWKTRLVHEDPQRLGSAEQNHMFVYMEIRCTQPFF